MMAGSDGIYVGGKPIRAARVAAARYLGHHVRNGDWTLEEAVQKCSYHAARRFGLKDRGLLREGWRRTWWSSTRKDQRSLHLRQRQRAGGGEEHASSTACRSCSTVSRTSASIPAGASARLTPTSPPAPLPHRASTQHPGWRATCSRAGTARSHPRVPHAPEVELPGAEAGPPAPGRVRSTAPVWRNDREAGQRWWRGIHGLPSL